MTTTLNPPDRSTVDWLGDFSGLGPPAPRCAFRVRAPVSIPSVTCDRCLGAEHADNAERVELLLDTAGNLVGSKQFLHSQASRNV